MVDINTNLYPLLNLTPIQKQYLLDDHRFQIDTAGRRSRKTLLNKRKVFVKALKSHGVKFIHGAPTQQQAKSIFWLDLLRYTKPFVKNINHSDLSVTLLNDSIIQIVGLDKPERIEGQTYPPIAGIHLTEIRYMKPDFMRHIRPILSDTGAFLYMDSAPKRNHWYDIADYASGGELPTPKPNIGAYCESKYDKDWCYYSWLSSDVLNADEISAVRRELDEKTFNSEYNASFAGVDGMAYYAFGDWNIQENKWQRDMTVHIGMDFNVDPMCAVLCHLVGDKVYQFAEVKLVNSNTESMCQYLRQNYIADKIIVYPDATGNARDTTSSKTDIEILRRYFSVNSRKSNPFQRDRVNCVNSRLKSVSELVRYFVDPSCTYTINDLRRVERLADGSINKTQEKIGLTHLSDALGYFVYSLDYEQEASFGGYSL